MVERKRPDTASCPEPAPVSPFPCASIDDIRCVIRAAQAFSEDLKTLPVRLLDFDQIARTLDDCAALLLKIYNAKDYYGDKD